MGAAVDEAHTAAAHDAAKARTLSNVREMRQQGGLPMPPADDGGEIDGAARRCCGAAARIQDRKVRTRSVDCTVASSCARLDAAEVVWQPDASGETCTCELRCMSVAPRPLRGIV